MNNSSPDVWAKFLAALDSVSGWTFFALAIASALILFSPYTFGVDLTKFRVEISGWLFSIMILSICLALAKIVKKVQARIQKNSYKSFDFNPLASPGSGWGASEQKDGSFTSQILLDCYVLNLTDRPLQFHSVQLLKPKFSNRKFIQAEVSVFRGTPSAIDYIPPHKTSYVRISFIIKGIIGKQGKDLKISLKVMDRFGNSQHIKYTIRDFKTPM